MHYIIDHIEMLLGLTDINGSWYAFWSGIGSDIAEFTLVGAVFRAAYKSRQQHSKHHQALMDKLTESHFN